MQIRNGGSGLQSDINVTPLVDVCLVLLIIFMVVTPMLLGEIQVTLPRASSGGAGDQNPQLTISLQTDGTLFAGGAIVREDDARAAIEDAARADATRPVVLYADSAVSHGRVVRILDICREAGFTQVAVATRGSDDSSGPASASATP